VLVAYAGENLSSIEQLDKLIAANARSKAVVVKVWRDGQDKLTERELAPGHLGVVLANEPAREAILARWKIDNQEELPGTRVEVERLAGLFDSKAVTTLTRADATEQRLDELRKTDQLKQFRFLHFATHGKANNFRSFDSALILTPPDKVPEPRAGEPWLDGRLTAAEVLEYWKLDAELVTLSACESALGRQGGGDGLLGFAQAFLLAGSRSVCLTLWQVDDTATVLLMDRFYRNLLGKREEGGPKTERTLENSEVRDYSWPCVLVFVSKWVSDDKFGGEGQYAATDQVPKRIYLPDGRIVPICVVLARPAGTVPAPIDPDKLTFPVKGLKCGCPVLTEVQKATHVASLGCLMTDGHTVYALTSRHVAGRPGEQLFTRLGGNKVLVGRASDLHLGRMPFEQAYEGWQGKHVYVNLDVGLVEVDDVTRWNSSVVGLGRLGPLADLSTHNLTLGLIGAQVRANGAVSSRLDGRIAALFYRYKSVGGMEYIADFLIGSADDEPLLTRPGDSGTIWALDGGTPDTGWMPLAVQWGGTVFAGVEARLPFALATNLSTVCRELDVDLYRGGVGSFDYWGAVGHYTIGSLACDLPADSRLKKLMRLNRQRVSFDPADVIGKANEAGPGNDPASPDFVPLADVPDKVWKAAGGHGQSAPFYSRGGPEHPNHYADMDFVPQGGQSLYDLTPDAASLSPAIWRQYYHDVGWNTVSQRGLLPFRVWQIYKAIVGFVQTGDVKSFVCAAGVLAHYVGDGSQPLHGSYLDDGDPFRKPDGTPVDTALPHSKGFGHGVHSAYEDKMLDQHADEVLAKLPTLLGNSHGMDLVTGGRNAGFAVVDLMKRTSTRIRPIDLVETYAVDHSVASLWTKFGEDTIAVIADGCRTLAMIWESAWKEGGGDAIPDSKLVAYKERDLQDLYESSNFVPSVALGEIDGFL
jgi:hypothetical protein